MDANELRAAAEMILLLRDDHINDVSAKETRDRLFGGMTMDAAEKKATEMICGLARHTLTTVHADDDEMVTVESLRKQLAEVISYDI